MRLLLTALGLLLLGIGAVGVVIPVLPTTPFVLLAAGCFGGSSPRLYRWLEGTRLFGPYLRNWKTGDGVEKGVKARSLVWLWTALSLSVLATRSLHLGLFLALVGTAVTVHILMIRTKN